MKHTTIIALLGIIALAGCQTATIVPDIGTQAVAEYGPQPTEAACIKAATAKLQTRLKDPASLKATWSQLPTRAGWMSLGDTVFYGYVMLAKINSKNSYGGYTGDQLFVFFVMTRGKLVECLALDPLIALPKGEGGWGTFGERSTTQSRLPIRYRFGYKAVTR